MLFSSIYNLFVLLGRKATFTHSLGLVHYYRISFPILSFPNNTDLFITDIDASDVGIGSMMP